MRRRLLLSTCLIAVAAVVVLGVPLGIVGSALLRNRADMRLERRADAAALRLARADARGQPLTLALVADVLRPGEALRVVADGRSRVLGRAPSGRTTRVVSGEGGVVDVTLIAPAAEGRESVGAVWLTVAALGIAAVIAAGALALLQARSLARPLERLARRVERVGRPDYDASPVAGRLPEVDELQLALNEADGRIAGLVRRERQFTANASHQLRTPLTGLRMRLEELALLVDAPTAREETQAALREVDRLADTIEHLEAFARRRDDRPELLAVSRVIANHLADGRWPERFARAGRRLDAELEAGAGAHVRGEALRQIADVLLDNALVHGRGGARLGVRHDGGWLRLELADDGPAPEAAAAARIFDRGVGAGSGLGLDVARELARQAGGELRLLPGPATRFEVLLPGSGVTPELSPRPASAGSGR